MTFQTTDTNNKLVLLQNMIEHGRKTEQGNDKNLPKWVSIGLK